VEVGVHLHAVAAELTGSAPSTPEISVILGMPYTQAGCFGKDHILMLLGISLGYPACSLITILTEPSCGIMCSLL